MSFQRKLLADVLALALFVFPVCYTFLAQVNAGWASWLGMLVLLSPVLHWWQEFFRKLLTPRQP